MNKSVLIAGVILLILAIGGYFLFMRNDNSDSPNSSLTNTNSESMENSSADSFNGTFSDLIKLGKNYTCTFDNTDENGNTVQGTVYVASSSDKMRGDFTFSQSDGTRYDGGVVRDSEYNYVWTSQFGGFKTKIDESDSLFGTSNDKNTTNKSMINDQTSVNFDCESWKVDESKFTPPSNIQFSDMSHMMMEMQNEVNNDLESGSIDCSVCDSAPAGVAREQCLQALGC